MHINALDLAGIHPTLESAPVAIAKQPPHPTPLVVEVRHFSGGSGTRAADPNATQSACFAELDGVPNRVKSCKVLPRLAPNVPGIRRRTPC